MLASSMSLLGLALPCQHGTALTTLTQRASSPIPEAPGFSPPGRAQVPARSETGVFRPLGRSMAPLRNNKPQPFSKLGGIGRR